MPFFELIDPCALEADGVQQETHQVGVLHILRLQQVGYHIVGFVSNPLVDDVQRGLVAEAEDGWRGVVVGRRRILESRFQRNVLPVAVEIDGVGNGHACVLVEQGAFREHFPAEGVHRGHIGIARLPSAGQHLAYLLAGDALGTVVEHPEGVGDAQWGDDVILRVACLAEQVEGEVAVLFHQRALCIGQGDCFRFLFLG